jgi:hypothetical protein
VDGVLVPALLLLVARDLVLFDPPRVLAWRILHDERLLAVPRGLVWLLPAPPGDLDRDPVALVLAAFACAVALAYLFAALARASVRLRGGLLAAAAAALVVAPIAGFIAMGALTGRPYGQDGGVVQMPLALDRILAGQTPYAADYSDSMLGKQARVSDFWDAYGGNPILRHHAYLPGTHLVMLPFHLLSRETVGGFDPRVVTLMAWGAAAWLAAWVTGWGTRGLAAAAAVLVSPLVYWHQIFGANDLLPAPFLLLAVLLGRRGRPVAAGAALGLACAIKHLAWPFAPFLLVALSGASGWRELSGPARSRFLRPLAAALAAFALAVLPVAALDLRAFWADVVVYNAGLGGTDNYPLGGTPGFGIANFVIYAGAVASLREHVPLGLLYLVLVPLVLWLLRVQMREGGLGFALACGSAALLATLYVSRVAHPNYLVLAAVLAPVGLLMDGRRAAEVVVAPLLLLALAVEVTQHEVLRATWEQAAAFGLPRRASGLAALVRPRAGEALTPDPLGLLLGALLAGLAVVFLWAGLLGAGTRVRRLLACTALLLAVVVPAVAISGLGRASGAVRAQDGWFAAVSPRAPVLEAWSPSFRRDPPRAIEPKARAPMDAAVSRVLTAFGRADPRLLLLVAFGCAAALLSALLPFDQQPLALAAALLTPAVAAGVAFGSPAILGIAGVVAAGLLAPRRTLASGAVLGATALFYTPALFAVPVVIAPRSRGGWRPLLGLAVALPALVGSLALEPGLGLANVLFYRDAGPAGAPVLLGIVRAGALAGAVLLSLRWGADRWALAAACVTLGLFLAPGASGHDVALPLALLAVASATGLVPEAGLEPAWISPHAPQTCVSANSTTPAGEGGTE